MQRAGRVIGNRDAIYKGSIYKFSIEKCAEGTIDVSYRIFNERYPFFHFVMRHDPCEPPDDHCSVCGWMHVCSLTCVSHVRIRKKTTRLPCVIFCCISSCCAARVTRSVDPGVNITRPHPPRKKKTKNCEFVKIIPLHFPHPQFNKISFLYSTSLVLYVEKRIIIQKMKINVFWICYYANKEMRC